MQRTDAQSELTVRVWDLPTRVFHWSLLLLVLVAWFTGEEEGAAAIVHRLAGEAIAGLLIFRVLWGFFGGERARFADFFAGPNAIAAHVRNMFSPAPERHLGHNPLGGVAVLLLLGVSAVTVITGLMSAPHDGGAATLNLPGAPNLAEAHEILFRILQALVALHVLAVVFVSIKTRDGLVPAMITGAKRRRADEAHAHARPARAASLIVAIALSASAAIALMTLTLANPPAAEAVHQDNDDD